MPEDPRGWLARSWGGLVTVGLAGGILPSPSALLLLLGAAALGRPWFGAALVLAFGVGMAATLCAAGLLASSIVERVQRRLPGRGRLARLARAGVSYGAAGGVCMVGASLVLRAALTL